MSLSINTNSAAMAALQSLNETTSALNQTENRVSTGKAVSSAADNPAVYAIAQTMNSQIGALTGVQSGLSFAAQVVNTASQAATSISSILSSLSQSIISGETTGYDAKTMNASLTQAMTQIDNAVRGATFQGVNLVSGALGDGVSFTSVSTAQDVNGSLYTQNGFNASSAGLGLAGLSVNQAGLQIDLGTGNTLASQLVDGNSLTLNNAAYGTTGATGTASNPAQQYQFIASSSSPSAASTALTTAASSLSTALGSVAGGLTIASDGSLSLTSPTAGETLNLTATDSDGSKVYTFKNGTTTGQVTVGQDLSGNLTFSATDSFDANGSANKIENITVVNINSGNAGSDMITAMQNAGFGVSQSSTGVLSIAGNNLDADPTTVSGTIGTTALAGNAGITQATGSSMALLTVQAAISKMNAISSSLGSSVNQVSQLSSATSSLSAALTTGVGALTDADLAAESARLTSLQTKQQLAIQSLSIANSQSSSILSLFRG